MGRHPSAPSSDVPSGWRDGSHTPMAVTAGQANHSVLPRYGLWAAWVLAPDPHPPTHSTTHQPDPFTSLAAASSRSSSATCECSTSRAFCAAAACCTYRICAAQRGVRARGVGVAWRAKCASASPLAPHHPFPPSFHPAQLTRQSGTNKALRIQTPAKLARYRYQGGKAVRLVMKAACGTACGTACGPPSPPPPA